MGCSIFAFILSLLGAACHVCVIESTFITTLIASALSILSLIFAGIGIGQRGYDNEGRIFWSIFAILISIGVLAPFIYTMAQWGNIHWNFFTVNLPL